MMFDAWLCLLVGESPRRLPTLHAATRRRIRAFGLALHLPVLVWALTGFVVSRHLFGMHEHAAAVVAGLCTFLVYVVERLVIATPGGFWIGAFRLLMGLVVALLAASAFDLVIFQREIAAELRAASQRSVRVEYRAKAAALEMLIAERKRDWMATQAAANCEANGTCGSGRPSVGPIYAELARQAERNRAQYEAAAAERDRLAEARARALGRAARRAEAEAGLLQRIEALHAYASGKPLATTFWALLFTLMLAVECMVIVVKWACGGTTVDDFIEQTREEASRLHAEAYLRALQSPCRGANELIEASYSVE